MNHGVELTDDQAEKLEKSSEAFIEQASDPEAAREFIENMIYFPQTAEEIRIPHDDKSFLGIFQPAAPDLSGSFHKAMLKADLPAEKMTTAFRIAFEQGARLLFP